jgi:hypothetical protein
LAHVAEIYVPHTAIIPDFVERDEIKSRGETKCARREQRIMIRALR